MKVNENDTIALSTLGSLELSEGHTKAALVNLRKALFLDPKNESARHNFELALFLNGKERQYD